MCVCVCVCVRACLHAHQRVSTRVQGGSACGRHAWPDTTQHDPHVPARPSPNVPQTIQTPAFATASGAAHACQCLTPSPFLSPRTTTNLAGLPSTCKIVYRALTNYFTPVTDYFEARAATAQAAADLFGPGSAEVAAVKGGWDVVGAPTAPDGTGPTCDATYATNTASCG
jgi:hypothetical protein